MAASGHYPVMLEEAVDALALAGGEVVVDATFGGGGHSRAILDKVGPEGRLVAVDRDPDAAARAEALVGDPRLEFRAGAFDEVLGALLSEGLRADAILFDLGLSSFQVDEPNRGFSYVNEGPLDMRMDPGQGPSAADFLNEAEEREISEALARYGDVPRGEARRISREILRRRPLSTTTDLHDAVRAAVGWKERGGNPAKRVFQAVRVRVNDELGGLERALEAAEALLVPGGRLVAITFHSGEDRIVKRFIVGREGRCTCPPELPVCDCGARPTLRRGRVRTPSAAEVAENPRSASARLRSATRTAEPLDGHSESHDQDPPGPERAGGV
jgi:16S rRNA (cytosine1402-N4)-methyltransferase